MKTGFGKYVLSALLTGTLILTSGSVPVSAAGANAGEGAEKAGITVAGEPETIQVSSDKLEYGENDFNEGWKFYLGTSGTAQNPNFDDSDWEAVTLPHDFSIGQNYTTAGEAESGFLPGGTGWYRKTFTLPESYADKTLLLNFDGVYSDAYVYINGTLAGENHYGYSSFAFDISEYVKCDGSTENVIAVRAVNNVPSSRWYSGSGIYRDVTLRVADAVHVDHCGTTVTTPDIEKGSGTVNIDAVVVNDSDTDVQVTVKNTIYAKDGEKASATTESEIKVEAGTAESVSASADVADPKLWSTESPSLYYVRTELVADGNVTDTYDTTFGFRYFSFDSENGFYLNGKAVKLNGVCLHHDQGALGSAAYDDAMYRQLSIMKDMGVNAVRTSHNPADEDFIDICNELGLLVIEEAFDGWELPKNGNNNDFSRYFNTALAASNHVLGGSEDMTWAEFALKSMIKRDRNDPSVILWSLGNEVQEGTSTNSDFAAIAAELIGWVKEVDTTRQTTIGSNQRTTSGKYGSLHDAVVNGGGIAGFNYASASELSAMHAAYGPIIASETSSAVNSRGIYSSQASAANADGKYHLTSYDTSTVSWGATAHDSMWNTLTVDYVAGEFVWTGFDYLGEPTPWNGTGAGTVSGMGAAPNSSYFGIVETTGFEKDTYYLYRSQWNQNDNTLHLVTAWDSDNMLTTGGRTPVVIYSNAPVIKLYRDDTLIGTAERKINTTSAGHTYYTYTTVSEDETVCAAVKGTDATSLYSTFNVVYQPGTISAKAFEEDGKTEIKDTKGNSSVSTPDVAGSLNVNVDKTEIEADGSSLAYISVNVEDKNGVLDTTASNKIKFTLNGNGEIRGVDNGDQATTAKYQQDTVLSDSTEAAIDAYAGKALVIVSSTKEAGSFTVTASSDGLEDGSVTVKTTAAEDGTSADGLISYTLVRDYTVKAGTNPELLTDASGEMADGSTVKGVVDWDEIPADKYQTAGDYQISGTLSFEGREPVPVSCRLHVIPDVIAVRNISTATVPETAPSLPDTVAGVLPDGTVAGEFDVIWETMTENQFAETGDIVTVKGNAEILGEETLPVTATVCVKEAVNTESTNVAPTVSSLTQDIAPDKQSDNLQSIVNGVTKPGDNTTERWTNWNNRTTSETATLTFKWDTAQLLNSVNLYYYYDSCSAYPDNVLFEYSLNGTDFDQVSSTEKLAESYNLGEEYTYTFDKPVNPVALRITFTQQDGTSGTHCVGLTEAEIMTYAGKLEYNSSAALSEISVDGTAISEFEADTLSYEAEGGENTVITAETDQNAGITVLPIYDNTVKILTLSEDGENTLTYEIKLKEPSCKHDKTETKNAKDATCTEEGYTGDIYCAECGELIKSGTAVPAKGHSWDEGKVTKEPTLQEEGEMTYTCTVCGDKRTESIPKLSSAKKVPKVTVKASAAANGKIALTGQYSDFENADDYYTVTCHGLVYYSSSKLGTRVLTVNTPGRTRVNFTSYKADGSFTYNMTPAYSSTKYRVRAFLAYTNASGNTMYAYSNPITVSYNTLR